MSAATDALEVNRPTTGIRPDIVFFETVTNGSEMTVLDAAGFLKLPILSKEVPALAKRKVIVVESGTKYIGLNSEMCGISYTYDEEILRELKRRRQRTGSLKELVVNLGGCPDRQPRDYLYSLWVPECLRINMH